MIGTVIAGKYRLTEKIGAGGMGLVFGATDVRLGGDLAIKLLHPHLSRDKTMESRFLQEARAAAAVQHPAIIKVTDLGREGDFIYMVMERLRGRSLEDHLRKAGPLHIDDAILMSQILLRGLSMAHTAGIVHRDIKPANIFLGRDHRGCVSPKILDFGLAKLLDGSAEHRTATGLMMGTPWYMSPEQVLADRNITSAADIWSYAMVFYVSVTKKRPYKVKSTPMTIVKAIMSQKPRSLREIAPGIPEPVAELISQALTKDPNERPMAVELAEGLYAACSTEREAWKDGMLSLRELRRPPRSQMTLTGARAVPKPREAETTAQDLAGGRPTSPDPISGESYEIDIEIDDDIFSDVPEDNEQTKMDFGVPEGMGPPSLDLDWDQASGHAMRAPGAVAEEEAGDGDDGEPSKLFWLGGLALLMVSMGVLVGLIIYLVNHFQGGGG